MKTARRGAPKIARGTYSFALIYKGIDELTDEVEGPLLEAGCDDATLSMRAGILRLDFDREAASFREALLSAIAAVDGCNLPVHLIRVEPISNGD